MTTPAISKRAVAALAALVHELRPDWDEPGVAAEIRRAVEHVPPMRLARSLLRAADDPRNETPAAIRFPDNACWSDAPQRCNLHPNAGTRTDGECGGCRADRMAAEFVRGMDVNPVSPPQAWLEARARLARKPVGSEPTP